MWYDIFKTIFKRARKPVLEEPDDLPFHDKHITVHNFTYSVWGHALHPIISPDKKTISFTAHSEIHINPGDHLLSESTPSGYCRYKVVDVEWLRDPRDMYAGHAIFIRGRTEQQRAADEHGIKRRSRRWIEEPIGGNI